MINKCIESFNKVVDSEMPIAACASCGLRIMGAEGIVRLPLSDLSPLKLTGQQLAEHLALGAFRIVRNVYEQFDPCESWPVTSAYHSNPDYVLHPAGPPVPGVHSLWHAAKTDQKGAEAIAEGLAQALVLDCQWLRPGQGGTPTPSSLSLWQSRS